MDLSKYTKLNKQRTLEAEKTYKMIMEFPVQGTFEATNLGESGTTMAVQRALSDYPNVTLHDVKTDHANPRIIVQFTIKMAGTQTIKGLGDDLATKIEDEKRNWNPFGIGHVKFETAYQYDGFLVTEADGNGEIPPPELYDPGPLSQLGESIQSTIGGTWGQVPEWGKALIVVGGLAWAYASFNK